MHLEFQQKWSTIAQYNIRIKGMNTRLDIIQQTRKTGFHEVCIEISGICNAKC